MADMQVRQPIDPDVAFDIYLRQAGRSYLRVAELTGIPIGTIRSWSTRFNWKETADRLEDQARTSVRQHILQTLDTGMPTALGTIRQLMTESSSDKVKHDASKTWVELWGKYRDLVSPASDASDSGDSLADTPDADLFAVLKTEANR